MRLFSPERANALIPVLQPLVDELWDRRRSLAILLLERDLDVRAAGLVPVLERPALDHDRRLSEAKGEVVRLINRIESFGCLLKDVDLGLLDFPSLRGARIVYLCWRSGESGVAYWHGTEEGFAGRRPL